MSVDFLVGYTGFVGSNLVDSHSFSGNFRSCDVALAYGQKPDLLVYAGVRSEMFAANRNPSVDLTAMQDAIQNIREIDPKEIVLISTVAVYPNSSEGDEDTEIDESVLSPYGANRLALERWVENAYSHCLIVRLPALFGKNLRKNFLYDYLRLIPALLTEKKFRELCVREPILERYYKDRGDGFFRCVLLNPEEERFLKRRFTSLGFTALNFTDSRSVYQFYALKRLWTHIQTARACGLRRVNLVTPPLSVAEVCQNLTGETFENHLDKPPYSYALHTKYDYIFSSGGGYVMSREQELSDIREFVRQNGGKCV